MSKKKNKLTYADAGVDIDAMEDSLRRIKKDVISTFNNMVIRNVGGFGTLHEIPDQEKKDQVLISSIDGVGTKMMVAQKADKYDTVGRDLVNHCVNDILTLGAKPLYFLDYVGTESLEPDVMEQIVSGLAHACRQNSMALLGGETAEMPGVYVQGESDLVGCITGIAARDALVTGSDIEEGDSILGLASSGLHTNGYSLARKIFFDREGASVDTHIEELGCTVAEELLKVHRSYFNSVYDLIQGSGIKGIAHITGGGCVDNIPRILPEGVCAELEFGTWEVLPVFNYIMEKGNVDISEMFRAFNMGIGLVLVVAPDESEDIASELEESGEKVWTIGTIGRGNREVIIHGI